MRQPAEKPRIGYVSGQARRLNERAIDGNWLRYLGEYADPVPIPPLRLFRLLGGSIDRFVGEFPRSLDRLSDGLGELIREYGLRTIYVNSPLLVPYLMMGRSFGGHDLGFLFTAHSVASEWWLRQWVGIAPLLEESDVILCSSRASREALLRISGAYEAVRNIPLCADDGLGTLSEAAPEDRTGNRLLSIGRLEDVKNIEALLRLFAEIRKRLPDTLLTIAGDYTESRPGQAADYRVRLETLVRELGLENHVKFAGPLEGESKRSAFRQADVLVNLSTDPGETFGYNLIEAKFWGIPVLCADWNGFREIVAHGEDGLLIDCRWDGATPETDERQALRLALDLLTDDRLRRGMSFRASQRAALYDYKRIFPAIIGAVVEAESARRPMQRKDIAALMSRRLADSGEFVRTKELERALPVDATLLEVLTGASGMELPSWMDAVKPIIGHYAGRQAYAEL